MADDIRTQYFNTDSKVFEGVKKFQQLFDNINDLSNSDQQQVFDKAGDTAIAAVQPSRGRKINSAGASLFIELFKVGQGFKQASDVLKKSRVKEAMKAKLVNGLLDTEGYTEGNIVAATSLYAELMKKEYSMSGAADGFKTLLEKIKDIKNMDEKNKQYVFMQASQAAAALVHKQGNFPMYLDFRNKEISLFEALFKQKQRFEKAREIMSDIKDGMARQQLKKALKDNQSA